MNNHQVIESLRKEAANPLSSAIFHVWAMRQRARDCVTLPALIAKMEKEGFKGNLEDYRAFLKRVSDLGLGRLEVSSTGKIVALRDIKTTLQSIGLAAVGGAKELGDFSKRNQFKALPTPQVRITVNKTALQPHLNRGVRIVVQINDKQVSIPVPKELDTKEIAELVSKLR